MAIGKDTKLSVTIGQYVSSVMGILSTLALALIWFGVLVPPGGVSQTTDNHEYVTKEKLADTVAIFQIQVNNLEKGLKDINTKQKDTNKYLLDILDRLPPK